MARVCPARRVSRRDVFRTLTTLFINGFQRLARSHSAREIAIRRRIPHRPYHRNVFISIKTPFKLPRQTPPGVNTCPPATLTPCRGWIICIYQNGNNSGLQLSTATGSIFISSLLSVKKAFENCFGVSRGYYNKLTVIALPCVLAMRARLSASAIPLSRRRCCWPGRRLTIPPLRQRNRKPSSRRTKRFCRDPQKIRDILATR